MAHAKFFSFALALLLQIIFCSFFVDVADADALKLNFYRKTCPAAEAIVRNTVARYVANDPTVAAPLLRLHFHDCFVRGCDGSVLLNSTKGNLAEKDAPPNLSLDGFYVIDAAKAELEKQCPGVVSCADISAIAARDAVFLIKGADWKVETGRRDGRVSSASEAVANLPSSFANIAELKSIFASKGLNSKDLATLSGAHTIGVSHCPSFDKRIYNYTGKGDIDPTLDPNYARTLRGICRPGDTKTTVDMDLGSATKFDNHYYQLVETKRGLFHSDEALLQDQVTRAFVHQFRSSQADFFRQFGKSMIRMGKFGVLTGNQGEIRKNCALVN